MITAEELIGMTKNEEQSSFKLGTVVELFEKGTVKVKFDGEDEPSEKEYSYLASYKPYEGDKVLLVRVAGTYIILGAVRYKIKPQNYITSDMTNDKNGNMNIDYMYIEASTGKLNVRRKNGSWTTYNPS